MKILCVVVCIILMLVESLAQNNQYLPPDKGYAYDKPNQQFPSSPQPQPSPGRPAPSYGPPSQDNHHHEPGMPFDFQYKVNDIETQNDYSHKAVSDGDVTRGEYRVQLPDGRTQIVRYTADWKNGYNAEVSYEGEAKYPEGLGQGGANAGGYKY
ncbi:pro-resilin-like [Anopheles merus]|uniref:pro-resilin-like n=2 Tax=Anopheles merus TaxID=30066 RepID=UPI001BE4C937|nr:pro-resilin-like [Anopheles merus]